MQKITDSLDYKKLVYEDLPFPGVDRMGNKFSGLMARIMQRIRKLKH